MAFPSGKDAYNLDNVSNVPETPKMSEMPFPMGNGDTGLDGVESVTCSSKLTETPEDAWPMGGPVKMDAVTDLPEGGANRSFVGNTGNVTPWPKAFED